MKLKKPAPFRECGRGNDSVGDSLQDREPGTAGWGSAACREWF